MSGYPSTLFGIDESLSDSGLSAYERERRRLYDESLPPAPVRSAPPMSVPRGSQDWQPLSIPSQGGNSAGSQMPASDAYEKYIQDEIQRRNEHPPSMLRKVLGTAVGLWAPGIGRQIEDPQAARFGKMLPYYAAGSKAEQDRLTKEETIASKRNQDEARMLNAQARLQALQGSADAREEALHKGEITEPTPQNPSEVNLGGPPPLGPPPGAQNGIGPADIMSPPQPSVDEPALAPLRSTAVSVPPGEVPPAPGSFQVPNMRNQPRGTRQIRLTPEGEAAAKARGQQEAWLPTPEPIKERYPNAPEKMPKEVLDTYVRAIESGDRNAADLTMRKEIADQANQTRREIAASRQNSGGQQSTDAKDIAAAIMGGDQPPDLKGLYRYGAQVRAEMARSGYDLTTASRDWQAINRHLSTLNGNQQERLRQAVTFTSESIPIIEDLYAQWQQTGLPGGFKDFNKAALIAASHLPGKNGSIAANLLSQINDLTSEMATVYKGGNSSTDEGLRLAASNLSADWNDQTFRDAVKRLKQNLQIRKNSILSSQPAGVSSGSPYLPKDAGRDGRTETIRYSSGGKSYDIPVSEEKEFLIDHPQAKKQ